MLKKLVTKEVLTVLLFGLVALAFLIASFDYTPMASLFPKIISGAVLLLVLVYLAGHLLRARKDAGARPESPGGAEGGVKAGLSPKRHWSVFMLSMTAYALLVYGIGFVISTFLCSLGIPYLAGYRKTKVTFFYALGIAAAMALIAKMFDIPLPKGFLVDLLIG